MKVFCQLWSCTCNYQVDLKSIRETWEGFRPSLGKEFNLAATRVQLSFFKTHLISRCLIRQHVNSLFAFQTLNYLFTFRAVYFDSRHALLDDPRAL